MPERVPPNADDIAFFQEKLEAVLVQLPENSFLFERNHRESFYHLLKRLRDWSSIFGRKDLYGIVGLLLRLFKRDDPEYGLELTSKDILLQLVKRLLHVMDGGVQQVVHQETAASSEPNSLFRTNVIVVDDRWHDFEISLDEQPQYTVKKIPLSDIETCVGQEILLGSSFVVIVNLAPQTSGKQIIAELKADEWGQDIIIIGIVGGSNSSEWNKSAASEADLVLAKPIAPGQLDEAIQHILSRKRSNRDIERHEMVKLLQKEWLRYVRFQTYFSLVYIKLDQFTYLVRTYGSKAALTFYAQMYEICRKTIRNYDEIKKWNVNGFVLMLPMSRADGAEMAAERMLGSIRKLPNAAAFLSFVKIGILESEHGYSSSDDMLVRLEDQLTYSPAHTQIYQVPLLQTSANRQTSRMKLLIVDEDLVAPTILYNHLSPDEWEVEICTEGAKAIEQATAFRPDVILSETSLTGINGFAFCLHVRQILSSKQTAFMFLSKQGASSNILRGLQVGADDYITKPFSVSVVEAKLRKQVSLRNTGG